MRSQLWKVGVLVVLLSCVRLQMHLDDLGGFGTEALTRWGLEFKRLSCDVAIVAA